MKRFTTVLMALAGSTLLLSSIGSEGLAAGRENRPARSPALDGKELYLANCKQCHGVIGEPTKSAQRQYDHIASFNDAAFFATRSEDSIVTVLKNGKGRDMKSFKEKLSEPEMHTVAQYVRTLAKSK